MDGLVGSSATWPTHAPRLLLFSQGVAQCQKKGTS
uniref:Uncharacterized protein n=1 Tax=Arundo donax TaxID=35708 RepID=A0A0A8ZWT1_ARUDO